MGSLGAGALLGAACVRQQRLPGASVSAAWTLAPVLKNPNSPIVMVDQMRVPVWLSHGQMNRLSRSIPPNIMGRIQANSYNFGQHFCAATNCTSSWPALLTGLYLPQTAMYNTGDTLVGNCALTTPAGMSGGSASGISRQI